MYVLSKPGNTPVFPYSLYLLSKDNPSTSFPTEPHPDLLATWHVYKIVDKDKPDFDSSSQGIIEIEPVNENGVWIQQWQIFELSDDEKAEILSAQIVESNNKHLDYLNSTDWYVIRKMETGKEIPEEIVNRRKLSRDSIVAREL
jgi:hypothetical protein